MARARRNKTEFLNTTPGWIGVVTIDAKGEEKPIALESGETVWLSPEEQQLTAEAPRHPHDNPFVAQPFEIRDPDTDELVEEGVRAPLEEVTAKRPTRPTPAAV